MKAKRIKFQRKSNPLTIRADDDSSIQFFSEGSNADPIQQRHAADDSMAEVSRWDVAIYNENCEGERDFIRAMREVNDIMDSSRQVPTKTLLQPNDNEDDTRGLHNENVSRIFAPAFLLSDNGEGFSERNWKSL